MTRDAEFRKEIIKPGQRPARRSGVVSSAEIEASVAASGVPDDTELTGTKPLRKKPVLEGEKDSRIKNLYGK
jgi:hypothetical protein